MKQRLAVHVGPFSQDSATIYTSLGHVPGDGLAGVACTRAGDVVAGGPAGVVILPTGTPAWQPVRGIETIPARWIRADSVGGVYIGTAVGVTRVTGPDTAATQVSDTAESIDAVAGTDADTPIVLTPHEAHQSDRTTRLPDGVIARSLARRSDGVIVIATDRGLFTYQEGELSDVAPRATGANRHARLVSEDVHELAADEMGGVWAATPAGINYVQDGILAITGRDGLPLPGVRCIAAGADGVLWVGGHIGAARLCEGSWRYYAGRRWLADDSVLAIALDRAGGAWLVTGGGLSKITFETMALPEKARHYEVITDARHNRDGYVTSCGLEAPGDTGSFKFEASDNDGLWTALYICAESFRWAVTRDPEARELARRSMSALLKLVDVTGIPGFPARAIIRTGERVTQSDPGPNWFPSPSMPGVTYKDDTSSDEIDGHYLAWHVYSGLVADAAERAAIAATCRAVTNHILDHDYTLVGPTGKHTRWGVWGPQFLNDDPTWADERGLNSLEILSHLRVAVELCGDARFRAAYRDLIERHGYAVNTVYQKLRPPVGEDNHSDDELAACAYYPLLQLEDRPDLRRLYLLSLQITQTILRPEHSPFYNVLYGACTGRPCDAEAAAQWLQDAPMDLRTWGMDNSRRVDVTFHHERGRFGERQLTIALPPNETRAGRWNHNPYEAVQPGDGSSEEDGAFWLLPYWMGRYHGIFVEESA